VFDTMDEMQPKHSKRDAPHRDRPPIIDVAKLLRSRKCVRLQHGDEEYRLTLTKANKLILTK